MAECTYVVSMKEDTGRKFSVRGTGPDAATAKSEAAAKLALTVGTVLKATASSIDANPPAANEGSYSDATIELAKNGKILSIHLENISTGYADANKDNGDLDITNQALIAFATAYKDGSGQGGYTLVGGAYTK